MAENKKVSEIKEQISQTYSWLQEEEIDSCFNMAFSDYLALKYPSENNRPSSENFVFDFFNTQWIYKRMIDILGRAGGISVTSYKENNLNLSYGASYIDPELRAQIMPRAGVPK